MGDRANIVVQSGEGRVFLYTHWSGSKLPSILRDALQRGRMRWTDEAYLARMIFSDMIQGHERNDLGFGISATFGDNDGYPLLVVDCKQQAVVIERPPGRLDSRFETIIGLVISFADYVQLESGDWDELFPDSPAAA